MVSHKLARRQVDRPQDERGQVIVLMVLMMVVLLGFAALVVDVGYAYYAHRSLQSSADAAALAGAQELPNATQAEIIARQYSSSAGNKNNKCNINGVTTTVTTKCVVSLGGCAPMNAVVVLEQAPTKTFFAGLLGLPAFTIKAQATASMRGGTPKPAHVMIVLDRTGSMGTACTIGGTKLDCAKGGINAFLGAMNPAYDQVGLVAFAPHSGNVCNTPKTTNGPTSDYDAFPNNYLFVPLSNDYQTSPGVLNRSLTARVHGQLHQGRRHHRLRGRDRQGAHDTGREPRPRGTGRHHLHDGRRGELRSVRVPERAPGSARTTPRPIGRIRAVRRSRRPTRPPRQASGSSESPTTPRVQGVWAGRPPAPASGVPTCAQKNGNQFVCPESPAITANVAVKAIASDDTKYYSSPNPGSLTTLFQSIAAELTEGRLLDDDAE